MGIRGYRVLYWTCMDDERQQRVRKVKKIKKNIRSNENKDQ